MSNQLGSSLHCNFVWRRNGCAYFCPECSIGGISLICSECFDPTKHCTHKFEKVYCEPGVWCDCGNDKKMKRKAFCSIHSTKYSNQTFTTGENFQSKNGHENNHSRDKNFKENEYSTNNSNYYLKNEFFELAELKGLEELPNSEETNKIKKYFKRSKPENCTKEVKKIYRINKFDPRNSYFRNIRRFLLWYPLNSTDENNLSNLLHNEFEYTNGKIGHALYFRDRFKYLNNYKNLDFGLVLLCDVTVGEMYRIFERKKLEKAPGQFNSVKGVGHNTPNKKKAYELNGVPILSGKTVTSDPKFKTEFDFNQYIIHDKNQVCIKYVILFQ